MPTGDKLASGAKSASFSTSDKSMTKEQWDAMFEQEHEDVAEKNQTMRNTLCDLVKQFARDIDRAYPGLCIYDFGDSVTVMPVPDFPSGSYLTKSICYVMRKGTGKVTSEKFSDVIDGKTVIDLGGGYFAVGVEIPLGMNPADLLAKLKQACEILSSHEVHGSLKARDIIPGWPKSRTTVILTTWEIEEFWSGFKDIQRPPSETVLRERMLTREYHEQQQAMVNAWLEIPLIRAQVHARDLLLLYPQSPYFPDIFR